MKKLRVIKSFYLRNLFDEVSSNINWYMGIDKSSIIDNNAILETPIDVPDIPPLLSGKKEDDFYNAVKIYDYLSNIDSTMASDARLWVYLSHVTFKDYVISRWPINDKSDINRVRDRWLLASDSARGLRRNAISRLWWMVYLTIAPWEKDEFFRDLKSEDRYLYTRLLFRYEDVSSAIIERPNISSNAHLLIAILEYIRINDNFAFDRKFYRSLLQEIILTLGYKNIMSFSLGDLLFEINNIAFDVKNNLSAYE